MMDPFKTWPRTFVFIIVTLMALPWFMFGLRRYLEWVGFIVAGLRSCF